MAEALALFHTFMLGREGIHPPGHKHAKTSFCKPARITVEIFRNYHLAAALGGIREAPQRRFPGNPTDLFIHERGDGLAGARQNGLHIGIGLPQLVKFSFGGQVNFGKFSMSGQRAAAGNTI